MVSRRQFGLGVTGFLSLLSSGCLSSITGTDDHEHEHDDPPWEWGGLYELEQQSYTYTYYEGPDPTMRLACIPTDENDEHGLFHAGETATELFEKAEADTVVTTGDTIQPSDETLYRVDFASPGETTMDLNIESGEYHSVFTEHVPEEFEAELRSEADGAVTPTVTELHSSHDHSDEDHNH